MLHYVEQLIIGSHKFSKVIFLLITVVSRQVMDAIRFYEESQNFYKLRKDHCSEFLKICIFAANLLAGKKRVARDMMLQFRNAENDTKTAFFLSVFHKDTNHRLNMFQYITQTY